MDYKYRNELIKGGILLSPAITTIHQESNFDLAVLINNYFKNNGKKYMVKLKQFSSFKVDKSCLLQH